MTSLVKVARESVSSTFSEDPDDGVDVGGTLRFSDSNDSLLSSHIKNSCIWSSKTCLSQSEVCEEVIPVSSEVAINRCQDEQSVIFEVVEARTVCDEKSKKYVLYTLAVKRPEMVGREADEGEIERRYSDFLGLYEVLKRVHPNILTSIPFPKKAILGNFTTEVITTRCQGFANFLSEVYLHRELRLSPFFAEFMYSRDARSAHNLMTRGAFEEAVNTLVNCYRVLEKLFGLEDSVAFFTLCLVVACYNAIDNVTEAQKFALIGLNKVNAHRDKANIVVPLLILSSRLFSSVSKAKSIVDIELSYFKDNGHNIKNLQTLLAVVLKLDATVIYALPPSLTP